MAPTHSLQAFMATHQSMPPGSYVSVRPCGADNPENKTYLGIYLGAAPRGISAEQDGDNIVIMFKEYNNPVMYVPALKRIVWGYESWWGPIETPDDLKAITDEDINTTWYVSALRSILEQGEHECHAQTGSTA